LAIQAFSRARSAATSCDVVMSGSSRKPECG